MNKERVNIQYSIDLNELPEEVVRLITRASSVAETALQAEFKDLKRIDEKAIDYALNDVVQIINGYLTFKVQENLQEQVEQAPAAPDPGPLHEDMRRATEGK